MRLRAILFATSLLAMPGLAVAQPIEGLYIGAGAGLHAPENPRVTPLSPGFGSGRIHLNQGYGFAAVASVGYGLGNGFRFEVEGDFMRSTIRQLNGTPFPTSSSGGHVRTWGVMANAIFDMDIGFSWIYPYLGLGAGYQWTTLNGLSATQPGGPFALNITDTAGGFAFQAIAGASFPIPGVPGLSATVDYRFMDILGGEKFFGTGQTTASAPVGPVGIKLSNQFNHNVIVGVRYAFFAPPPPPPPSPAPTVAPAPAPSRSYLVFFDWDKATLTDRARQVIKEAADNSTRVQYTRIEVNGYTDTSGSPQYNQRLSVRRAQAVAAELVRNGVPREAIAIQGFGETNLLVQTGPNVREAQNRRVEIILR